MTTQPALSWRDALAIYLRPAVLRLLFLGFSAGLPYLLIFSTLSAWLAELNVSRSAIGFFGWLGITYSIKVLWAPVVDSIRLPWLHRLGRRRSWMLLAQLIIATGLLGMAFTDPASHLWLIALLGLAVAFGSATQDIAIDAYRIESADVSLQAAMSASYILGYRLALLMAGAGALYIAEWANWPVAYISMAALMAVGVITVLVIAEPVQGEPVAVEHAETEQPLGHRLWLWFQQSVLAPFRDFFQRTGWLALWVLLFIAIYRISDITMGIMANPFYLDMGFSKSDIANITKVFGFFMTILGSALGGVLVVKWGMYRVLLLGAVMVASTNLLFALMASLPASKLLLIVAISADNLSGGIAITSFIAYLSGLTSTAYTATQYALFSSLMTLPGKFISGFSGIVVDSAGYVWFFTYASATGIPAIILVLFLMRRGRSLLPVSAVNSNPMR